MDEDEVIAYVHSLGGVVAQRPTAGDGTPEIAWGDTFFWWAPDGEVPRSGQPFATVTTKDYPGEPASGLDRPEDFRVNLHVGSDAYERHLGHRPQRTPPPETLDHRQRDVLLPHPSYARLGWVCVVVPGERTAGVTRELLAAAHRLAHQRQVRRGRRPDGAS